MSELISSFGHLMTMSAVIYIFIGVTAGIVVGAIPGLTGAMLISLTLPLTYYMDSGSSMILLISMYVGSISGSLITAILLRIPGTPASVITTFDGYPMAMAGKPGRAIGIGIMASFIGGLISWIFLAFLSPLLGKIAVKMGPFEFFSMVLMALVLIASISEGSFIKGILSGFLGLLVATPGIEPVTGQPRLDFGIADLAGGFHLLPVLIGIFGANQIIRDIINSEQKTKKIPLKLSGLFMSLNDLKKQAFNLIRSSLIGTWIGILPGIGANIGSVLAYGAAKNSSKHPEKFGTGIDDGIAASEAANNATIGGALIPLLTLGIPGSVIDAILLGALLIHNVQAGPLLFVLHAEIAYNIIITALIANLFMFVIMIISTKMIAKIIEVPKVFLIPVILVFCVMGTFALHNTMFDVWVMLLFGVLGFVLEMAAIPLGPFVIGLILCPVAELSLRSGLMASGGSFAPLVTRPVSLAFMIIAIGTLVWSLYKIRLKSI